MESLNIFSSFKFRLLEYLSSEFNKLINKNCKENIIKILNPDFIFYLSGVDILKTDKLGRLNLSIEGCKKRDSIILNLCKTFNIPLQISMGGGYSKNIEDIIDAHCNTFRLAKEIYF